MVTFVVLNYVVSIICCTMEDSAEIDAVVNAENYELLNYATDKFSKFPGMKWIGGEGDEKISPTSHWLLNESKLHIVTSRLETKLEELDCVMSSTSVFDKHDGDRDLPSRCTHKHVKK